MITAISWGPWRAESRNGVVYVRRHRERGKPMPEWIPTTITDRSEAGLREAIWRTALADGQHAILITDADPTWAIRLVEAEYA